ncbi:hypothetical protein [Bosea robiniae]|uniref:Uncharacterized protein n=1 Tax=Bosea robiniae TaxID=1036780 RepID=A0ABY0P533_9HYPH|nr:hypothetical protein [Bosea robiniae]SDH22313.1 hypothetical protein SAMN05421844_107205 [Bosea robiniae]
MGKLRDIEFRSAATQAYGKNWQWRLAVARNYNLRTVQTWAAKPTENVPEEAYAHVRSARDLIEDYKVADSIKALTDELQALGLNPHVVAAQLHAAADKLSDPGAVPKGAPQPKAKNPPVRDKAE